MLVGWCAWAASASVARRSDLLDYKYGQNEKCFKKHQKSSWSKEGAQKGASMDSEIAKHHLSQIETHWTAVFQAHQGRSAEAAEAQAELVLRYGGAVHRYLLASLHDVDAADELSQEFALRFLRGDFKNADPGKGRFRDFLKRSIYRLMVDYHRARQTRPRPLDEVPEPAALADSWDRELDRQFLESWREQLMAHAWSALDRVQQRRGQPFADVLRLRVSSPDLRSPELAEQLSDRLGRPVKPAWVRLNLHRARDMFVKSLLDEVKRSLGSQPQRLDEELAELGLLEYCQSVLNRSADRPV
jgi:RNA polymerase sigma-70 factor (ECF subfamily)